MTLSTIQIASFGQLTIRDAMTRADVTGSPIADHVTTAFMAHVRDAKLDRSEQVAVEKWLLRSGFPVNHARLMFEQACDFAASTSTAKECTIHVNARLGMVNGVPAIVGYTQSDWFDDSTVRSFNNGRASN